MPTEDRILDALSKIQEDTTKIREDISFLKAKNEEHGNDIDELKEKLAEISEKKIPEIHTELATLKTKAAIGGAIAGSFLGIIAALLLKAVDWVGSFFGG